jgi:hypothetical protein
MNRKGEPLYPLNRPCPDCGETDAEKFHYHTRNVGNRAGTKQRHKYCVKCTYQRKVATKGIYRPTRAYLYHVKEEYLQQLYISQGGRCAICKEWGEYKKLHVDHNHITGKVRGFLCPNCNKGLGHFLDDSDLLRKAADYIDRDESLD